MVNFDPNRQPIYIYITNFVLIKKIKINKEKRKLAMKDGNF